MHPTIPDASNLNIFFSANVSSLCFIVNNISIYNLLAKAKNSSRAC